MINTTKNRAGTSPDMKFTRAILDCGNHKVRMYAIKLDEHPEYGDRLIFSVEGEPIETPFKGLPVDKNDPAKGNFKGQVGTVRHSRWSFKDYQPDNGPLLTKEEQTLEFLEDLCIALAIEEWYRLQDNKYETIVALVNAMNQEKPFEGIWFYVCLAGREYMNGTYVNAELFLPKKSTLGVPYSLDEKKVIKYFEHLHLEKLGTLASVKTTVSSEPVKTAPAHNGRIESQEDKDDFLASLDMDTPEANSPMTDINTEGPVPPWEEDEKAPETTKEAKSTKPAAKSKWAKK